MVDRSTAGLSDLHPRLSFFSTVLLLLFSHFSVSFLASFSLSLSLSSLSLFLPLPPSRSPSPSSLYVFRSPQVTGSPIIHSFVTYLHSTVLQFRSTVV